MAPQQAGQVNGRSPFIRSIAGRFEATVIAMRRAALAKLKVQDAWIAATAPAPAQVAEVWTISEESRQVISVDE